MSKPFNPSVGDIIRNKKQRRGTRGSRPHPTWKVIAYDLQMDSYQLKVIYSSFGHLIGKTFGVHAGWVHNEMELDTPGKRMVTW